jgi:hypothetical protein
MYPYSSPNSLLSGFKTIKWGSLLDGTQKTLGVINQAIPLIYQVKPLINNAKTILNVVGAINDNGNNNSKNISTNNNTSNNTDTTNNISTNNSPIFYI